MKVLVHTDNVFAKGPVWFQYTKIKHEPKSRSWKKKIARKLNGLKKMYWSIFFFDVDESQVPKDYFALKRELGDDG